MNFSTNKKMEFYIGIPFCKKACAYCHYRPNIRFGITSIPDKYVHTLCTQIQTFLQTYNIHDKTLLSCYFGGGTPSLLSPEQISSIYSIFQKHGISFQETSIEIHPASFDEALFDLPFFNRFSLGIQSTNPQIINRWNRESYPIDKVQKIYTIIREKKPSAIINLDFLMDKSFSDTDIVFVKRLMPDTVVFYPKTGVRTEKEAARTYVDLKKIELLLDGAGYFRANEYSFHFFKNHKYLSKYANGEYSFEADIIGFGHNSLSRIENESFLSLYSPSNDKWEVKKRTRDPESELLWGSLPYGIPLSLEKKLPSEILMLLRYDKHFGTKYIPLLIP